MKRKDKINLVINAMKEAGLNDDLNADGTVGKQAAKAASRLLSDIHRKDTDDINLVIHALKQAGFNDKLEADGEVGIQAIKAIGRFLALAGN